MQVTYLLLELISGKDDWGFGKTVSFGCGLNASTSVSKSASDSKYSSLISA
jgi:hypothetical protein